MDDFGNSPLPVFSTAVGDQSAVGSCFIINNPAPNALDFESNAKDTTPAAMFHPLFRHVNKVVVVKPGQHFTVLIPSAGTSQTPVPATSAAPFRTPSPFDNVSPPPPVPTPLPLNVFVKSAEVEKNPTQHNQANDKAQEKMSAKPKSKWKINPSDPFWNGKLEKEEMAVKKKLGAKKKMVVDFHSCHLCGQIFRYGSALREHILCVHTEDSQKPYTCIYCGKGFVRESRYNEHMLNHRGIKAYSCALCCVRFTSKDNAIKHVEVCCGAKEYTCVYCENVLPSQSSWYKHMKGTCPAIRMEGEESRRRGSPTKIRRSPIKRCLPKILQKPSSVNPAFQHPQAMKKTIIYLNKLSSTPLNGSN